MTSSTCQSLPTLLSRHDQHVLDAIFESQLSNEGHNTTQIDVNLPPDQRVSTETVELLVELEKQAIQLQERGEFDAAMAQLNKIVEQEPNYASAYNNRAQMYRIMMPGDVSSKKVKEDLESAIALALPVKPHVAISKMQATVLRNAYNQFAAIYLEQSRQPENADSAWKLQLKASDMMVEASKYGEKIAAMLAVHVNPYAKLCGNIMELARSTYDK